MTASTRQPIRERHHRLPKDLYTGEAIVAFTACALGRETLFSDHSVVGRLAAMPALLLSTVSCPITFTSFSRAPRLWRTSGAPWFSSSNVRDIGSRGTGPACAGRRTSTIGSFGEKRTWSITFGRSSTIQGDMDSFRIGAIITDSLGCVQARGSSRRSLKAAATRPPCWWHVDPA